MDRNEQDGASHLDFGSKMRLLSPRPSFSGHDHTECRQSIEGLGKEIEQLRKSFKDLYLAHSEKGDQNRGKIKRRPLV